MDQSTAHVGQKTGNQRMIRMTKIVQSIVSPILKRFALAK
jgi:hypothetical protein